MKILKNVLLSITVMFFVSCSIFQKVQAPPHSDEAVSRSGQIINQTHTMYDNMLLSPDKSIGTWQPSYDSISQSLQYLVTLDAVRKNNTIILKLTNDWLARLNIYEGEHQTYGSLNKSQIRVFQDFMDNAGNKVYQTESNYK